MPRDAEIVKNDPPLINDFAVQRADGADLAMRFYHLVAVAGPMPDGEDTHALGERTPEQWQQDAFGQIDALLRAMALRA